MKIILPILLLVISLTGCQTTQDKETVIDVSAKGLQQVVAYSVDTVIIPNINQWHQASVSFNDSSKSFCQAPNKQQLVELQNEWKELSIYWNNVVMFDFGPFRSNLFIQKIHFVESKRQRGKNYSSTVRDRLNQRLNDDIELNEKHFANLNFNLVGMSALELMLFEDFTTSKTDSNSILNNFQQNPRSCQLLTGMSNLNKNIATYVKKGWLQGTDEQPSYRTLFLNNNLLSGKPAKTTLIFAMQDYFRYINQRKLSGKLDAKLSATTYPNMLAGLYAIEDLFTAKGGTLSLQKYLYAQGKQETSDKFIALLATAKQQAKQQNRDGMILTYNSLTKMLETDIPHSLGVNFGMNFTDGD